VEALRGSVGGVRRSSPMYIGYVMLPCWSAKNSVCFTSSFCHVACLPRPSPRTNIPWHGSAGNDHKLFHVRCDELIRDNPGRHPDMVRAQSAARVPPSLRTRARQYWHAIRINQRSFLSFKVITLLVESGALYFVLDVRFLLHNTLGIYVRF
jgi:hypothetical protein